MVVSHSTTVVDNVDSPNASKWNAPHTVGAPYSETVGPTSYVVYLDGVTYYARNGKTGAIDFSGPSPTGVVQNAINNLTNGFIVVMDGVAPGALTHKVGVAVVQEIGGSWTFLNGSVGIKVKAGAPADADFGSPVDGLLEANSQTAQGSHREGAIWIPLANAAQKTITAATYTALISDNLIIADATSGAITITLPAANAYGTSQITVVKKDSSANTVTVQRAGADTIEGLTSLVISLQRGKVFLVSDGVSIWYDLGRGLF